MGASSCADRARRCLAPLVTVAFLFGMAGNVRAQAPPVLLDLPFVAQTTDLCGGAAAAMVLRYWGERDVFAEDFASLVDPGAGGIRTSALTAAIEARGWPTLTSRPSSFPEALLRAGRPVIALLEDRPDTYHYVVVVGLRGDDVVVHDPARAPFQTMPRGEFEDRWEQANRWMLVVLPRNIPESTPSPTATQLPVDTPVTAGPCGPTVHAAVQSAKAGDQAAAEEGLLTAVRECAGEAAGWRELAGLRFLQRRYGEASALAERAADLEPDAHTWQLLGTARYLDDDRHAALEAWNEIGEPRVDLVRVAGARRTRHPLIVGLTGLEPRQLLSRAALDRAAHRVAELPVALTTDVRYARPDGGPASVTVVVNERRAMPAGWIGWAAAGVRTAFLGELRVEVPGLAGDGELFSTTYRWAANRPRIEFGVGIPAPGPLPGIVRLELFRERETYALPTGESPPHEASPLLRQDRRRGAASLSDWPTGWLRWELGAGVDRIDGSRFVPLHGGLNTRWAGDRVAVIVEAGHWIARDALPAFSTAEVALHWRSTRAASRPRWTTLGGFSMATRSAPLALWPGASSGKGRSALLRAHPLLDDGVVTGATFGRELAFATVEYERPIRTTPHGRLGAAVFLDVAQAWKSHALAAPGPQADIGTGIRLEAPGLEGRVRIDAAWGLRDGRFSLSAGYLTRWGWR